MVSVNKLSGSHCQQVNKFYSLIDCHRAAGMEHASKKHLRCLLLPLGFKLGDEFTNLV